MKKSLVKKITFGILTGAVLMSSSVAWADSEFVTHAEGGTDSFYLGFKESTNTAIQGDYNFAVGSGAKIESASKSVVIGTNAKINGDSGSVALGYGSIASDSNVVSVGDGGAVDGNNQSYGPDTRSIINVTDIATAANIADGTKILEICSTYGSYAVNLNTLQKALSEISSNSGSADVYTKSETNNAITSAVSGKADKATTLAGYGITDAYTKAEVDNAISSKTGDLQYTSTNYIAQGDNLTQATSNLDAHVKVNAEAIVGLDGKVENDTQAIATVNSNLVTAINTINANVANSIDTINQNIADSINTINGGIATEKSEREAADADLEDKISNESVVRAEDDRVNAEAIAGFNQRLEKTNAKINKVGAGAAAFAALHPLDYDPDDKLTFSAGMGNYAGENASALGTFYRPNEKFMLSLGGTMGNGENMVNLGLSIGFDKPNGFAKMSKR